MLNEVTTFEDLDKKQKARLILDFFHRTIMHHSIWYAEVMHQYGREKALEIMNIAWENSYNIQMKRLSEILNFQMEEDIPKPLLDLNSEKLTELGNKVAINWLANDGVWFQAVEFNLGMFDAKRINDSTWAQFSPFEAWSIKKFLNMDKNPGLEGLKKALNFRLYASINKQSIVDETEKSFVFRMDECRVQLARKRKGMEDYPCKSGGLVEYKTFAEAIDSEIKTECLACPPDVHPQEWFCAWKFYID